MGDVSLVSSLRNSSYGVIAENQTTLHNGSHSVVVIQLPASLPEPQYSLTVVGSGGLNFYKSRLVFTMAKALSIFVQTDKAVYHPGEKVLFRTVVMNPDLKPYNGNFNITIQDSKRNIIIQWLNQNNINGFFNNTLQLSSEPSLGTWIITVTSKGFPFAKSFKVAKYKPAAFAVEMHVPPLYYINEQQIHQQHDFLFSIKARVPATGLPVSGVAHVNITVRQDAWEDWWMWQYYTTRSNRRELLFDVQLVPGEANVTVTSTSLRDVIPFLRSDINNILSDADRIWYSALWARIRVVVTVTNSVNGEVVATNSSIPCLPRYGSYRLEFLDNSTKIIKPGMPHTATLRMRRYDGNPLTSEDIANRKVVVVGYCSSVDYSYISYNVTTAVPVSGLMFFTFPVDCYYDSSLGAYIAEDAGNQSAYGHVYWYADRFYTRDNEALQILLISPTPTGIIGAGSAAVFRLLSTRNTTSLFYQLLSKGILIKSDRLTFPASTSHDFSISIDTQLSRKLAPAARVVAWYITEAGEIISESLDFSVTGTLTNQVSATFSATSVQPGDKVTVYVNAYPGSYIGLLATDQGAILVPGNDITLESILQDLLRYHNDSRCLSLDYTRRKRDVVTSESGARSTSSVFYMAGVTAMTDSYVYGLYDNVCNQLPFPTSPAGQNVTDDSKILNYLETWLWTDVTANADGRATLQVTVPDHVASWMLTAFAISPAAGLGVVAKPVNLTATRQIYLSIRAPYAVVRGEECRLQVTVFNYRETSIVATVVLQRSGYFKVRIPTATKPQESSVTSTVEVRGLGSRIINFWIVPQTLGPTTVYVTGVSGSASYTATGQVFVKPEGVAQQYAESVIVNPAAGVTFNHTFSITLPRAGILVPGSQHIFVTAIGDLMGQSLDGLGNLLQMPYGCGEQNMMNFAPDVYILKYLRAIGKSTADVESKANQYITAGYQREMTYQRTDGSFSAFGNWDQSGSAWLTAFVAKCFHEAREFIPLDEHSIAVALSWLLKYQKANGAFVDPGRIYHWDMQGGSSGGEPLTAYVLISLMENYENSKISAMNGSNISSIVNKTAHYLESRLDSVKTSSYALNIMCYALQLSGSSLITKCLQYLDALAVKNNGQRYWTKSYATACPYCSPRAVDVEMTAYGLLTYTRREDLTTAASISKWIVGQRNGNGGYISTQDTVVALQALAKYAELTNAHSNGNSLLISLQSESWSYSFDSLTSTNAIVLQTVEVPSQAKYVTVNARGGGVLGIVQLIVKYNAYVVNNTVPSRRKRSTDTGSSSSLINIRTDQQQITDDQIVLLACATYSGVELSGMCIMEITMPSGYAAAEPDNLRGQANGNLKKVEVDEDTNNLVLYLDELVVTETCVNMTLNRLMTVSNAQPARVTAYLYYNPAVKTIHEYKSVADEGKTWADQCPECSACSAPDYFTCDGGQCHAASAKCNGVSECLDGQDENGCANSGGSSSHNVDSYSVARLSKAIAAFYLLVMFATQN
jgi:CD109 antigen